MKMANVAAEIILWRPTAADGGRRRPRTPQAHKQLIRGAVGSLLTDPLISHGIFSGAGDSVMALSHYSVSY